MMQPIQTATVAPDIASSLWPYRGCPSRRGSATLRSSTRALGPFPLGSGLRSGGSDRGLRQIALLEKDPVVEPLTARQAGEEDHSAADRQDGERAVQLAVLEV